MALFKNWKPKTIAGKILKGTTIGVLGAGAIASGVGAIAGAVGGAGLLAGAAGGIGTVVKAASKVGAGTKTVLSKVSASAVKLVTGETKEQREVIKQVKEQAREAKDKYSFIEKLKKAGLSEKQAYEKAGVTYDVGGDVKTESGTGFLSGIREKFNETGESPTMTDPVKPENKNMLVYASLGLAGLFLLPKILQ